MKRVSQLCYGAYIDESIEDTRERGIDWNIAIYTLTEQWHLVLLNKWRRAVYLSTGRSYSTPSMLRPGYIPEEI